MVVEAVEQVVDAKVQPHLLPLVAGAQVQQAVACSGQLVAHGRKARFSVHHQHLGRACPGAQALGQGHARVQRHDVVEVVARGAVLAVDEVEHAAQGELAPLRTLAQVGKARKVKAVQARILVGKLQVDKARVGRLVGAGAGRHGAAAAAAAGVDVVVHIGEVRRELHAPALTRGVVPVGGGAQGVGGFGLEVGVAHVTIAITHHVDHAHGHAAGGPGVALIEVGRARLVRKAELVGGVGVGRIACQGGEVDVVVAALAVTGVEGIGLHVVVGVVALHGAAVHAHMAAAQAHLREPLRVPA